jgi:hypothetical protein
MERTKQEAQQAALRSEQGKAGGIKVLLSLDGTMVRAENGKPITYGNKTPETTVEGVIMVITNDERKAVKAVQNENGKWITAELKEEKPTGRFKKAKRDANQGYLEVSFDLDGNVTNVTNPEGEDVVDSTSLGKVRFYATGCSAPNCVRVIGGYAYCQKPCQ